jgi:hypothetical protein
VADHQSTVCPLPEVRRTPPVPQRRWSPRLAVGVVALPRGEGQPDSSASPNRHRVGASDRVFRHAGSCGLLCQSVSWRGLSNVCATAGCVGSRERLMTR